ncbi:MAG: CHAD domain-containing protein [Cyanobacteriota bacterium]|nr:CHAD domain-containing protein [Cyanobacteriota bacterium]
MISVCARSSGEHAAALLDHQVRALIAWHAPVLADRDPEPLHQLRVSMRRLRVTLTQFAPVLRLPAELRLSRLAKTSRRLGLARDLDVLQERLQQQLLPHLPAAELELLRPVLKQLRRERCQAHQQVVEQLKGGSYLSWLAQMQRWLRKPAFTPLAEQPLADALVQWQLPWIAELFVHPAWAIDPLVSEAQREQLHSLRKQIKLARYQLDNCKHLLGRSSRRWQRSLKAMQEQLGELNDLQVLQRAIADQLHGSLPADLPALSALLQRSEAESWQAWRHLAGRHGGLEPAQQLLGALRRDRSRALLRKHSLAMCSALHGLVFCDWRAPLAAR